MFVTEAVLKNIDKLKELKRFLDGDYTPTANCPRCGAEQPDYDGFGVLYCPACGFCEHPAYNGDVCDICGQVVE